jgi:hypothetical protein
MTAVSPHRRSPNADADPVARTHVKLQEINMLDHRRIIIPTLVVAAALAAAACGSGGTTATPAASAPVASAPAGGPAGNLDFAKIQQCLTAAGIALPSVGSFALPSGGIPQRPPGSFAPPSGSFAPPSGGFPGGRFNDPATLAALKACGIELPSAPSANP